MVNARRGAEPAHLIIDNWMEARNNVWLNKERLVQMVGVNKRLFSDMKVMYQFGKGNHLVPVLVATRTVKASDKLCDSHTRNDWARVAQCSNAAVEK